MEFDLKRTSQITGLLLLITAVTQVIYTALYVSEAEVPRQLIWGTEGLLFVLMAAFAGAALVQSHTQQLAWSAILAAAILNVVQVGIGLTMFGPFFQAAAEVEGLAPAAGAVVAYSFMVYNAAKILLALALMVFGMAKRNGSPLFGWLCTLVGLVALITNTVSMSAGRDAFGDLPLAGGSGVIATVLLAVCLLSLPDTGDEER